MYIRLLVPPYGIRPDSAVNGRSVLPGYVETGAGLRRVLFPSTYARTLYFYPMSRINAYRYTSMSSSMDPTWRPCTVLSDQCAAEIYGSACGCSEDLG